MAAAMTQLTIAITQGLSAFSYRWIFQMEYNLCLRMKDAYIFCCKCFYKMHCCELKEQIKSHGMSFGIWFYLTGQLAIIHSTYVHA